MLCSDKAKGEQRGMRKVEPYFVETRIVFIVLFSLGTFFEVLVAWRSGGGHLQQNNLLGYNYVEDKIYSIFERLRKLPLCRANTVGIVPLCQFSN